jgi:hypothetical protein
VSTVSAGISVRDGSTPPWAPSWPTAGLPPWIVRDSIYI